MTEGNPVQLLLVFAVPMLIGNVFQQLYNLVDSVIVGKFVGANALAAVGATGSVSFLFFALCNGLGSGGGIITAQQFGAGNKENVKKAIINSAYILVIGAILMGALAFAISEWVLTAMATPQEILQTELYFIDRIGIRSYLSPTRANGLSEMLSQMKRYALAFSAAQGQ